MIKRSTLTAWLAARLAVFALAIGMVSGLACGDENDEIGTPCESTDDCSGDLICDIHEGQGTCQEPHPH